MSLIRPFYCLLFVAAILMGCGLLYSDWQSGTAYRSPSSKGDYFLIKGLTQSHCGCSDLVVRNYRNRKIDFVFYYGGGLFPARKYVYRYSGDHIDTLVYLPVVSGAVDVPLDSLDLEIIRQIDTLISVRPKGSGLVYPVKRHAYIGFVREKKD